MQHPYANFLHAVEKPSRYTGAEHGSRRKDWAGVEARICLAFPEVYDIGMSHLGFRILYKILNDDARTLAERCYCPWVDLQSQLASHGQLLVSLESARPLCDFDVVGFSLQFELTFTNILTMLELGGIPLRAAARGDDDPLVIAGGPTATHAEPVAAFFDAIVIGDGEQLATDVALTWVRAKREGLPREARLKKLAGLVGVYVPSLYDTATDPDTQLEVVTGPRDPSLPFPIERHLVGDLSKFPFPDDGPVGGPEAVFERLSIEIARGCTEGCRFCQAGMIYRPVRERDPEEIVRTVENAIKNSGQDEVALTALSTADVSSISPLIKRLAEKTAPERVSLGVASLRAYGLAEDLLDDLGTVRASGLTFAPEAGTQRMRDVVNKNVTEEQLVETAERTFSRGFDKMKLYFMIGLPTETEEDVAGIVEVGKNALAAGRRVGNQRAQVTVSVSTHVPKPHTPFQWCAMDGLGQIETKQALLQGAARRSKGLQLRMHECGGSVLEGILARGDRPLANVIERAWRNGARFDAWDEHLRVDVWKESLAHFGVDPERYLGTIPVTARLPWDHIDVGLEEGFLAREYRKALESRLSPPCGKVRGMFIHHTNVKEAAADARKLVCYDCGVACDLSQMRQERIDFLGRMGAMEPGQRARLPVVQQASNADAASSLATTPGAEAADAEGAVLPAAKDIDAGAGSAARRGQRLARFRPPRIGTPERWRFRFEKTGPAALLGHLDLGRELPRVLRRAGLRIAYSEGFHPHPDLSFSPALSLGIASLDEHVDVQLLDAPAPAEVLARLAEATPEGLRVTGAVKLGPRDPGLSKLIDGARYLIAIPVAALPRGTAARAGTSSSSGRAWLSERLSTFLAETSVRVRRDVKGLAKMVDVRAFVRSASVDGDEAEQALDRAGLVGNLVALDVTVSITSNGAAKVGEIVEAICGERLPHRAVRLRLLAGEASPLDLDAVRPRPAPAAPVPTLSAE